GCVGLADVRINAGHDDAWLQTSRVEGCHHAPPSRVPRIVGYERMARDVFKRHGGTFKDRAIRPPHDASGELDAWKPEQPGKWADRLRTKGQIRIAFLHHFANLLGITLFQDELDGWVSSDELLDHVRQDI